MKKIIVVVMMLFFALTALGCSGRNAEFGVVDMARIEAESQLYKEIRDDVMTKAQAAQEEMMKASVGKSEEDAQKIMQEKSAEMQVVQSEAQNKLKTSFNAALNKVAQEKKLGAILTKDAVPQGGTDVTDEVLKNMK
ncbi:MAG: OmpH family outer membrane protein [Acholeplasmataceae bacterium]|jgi:outer membrane protein|nr:OmpH family outer membrane protein [Acidaminococcaceae bacterium]NLY83140.1 OmpH family outer membrane protein [Acholeplasmataceae bacterium]